MKKIVAILLCVMLLTGAMSISVSAGFVRTDTVRVYRIDNVANPDEDPLIQGTKEDEYITWYTYNNGRYTMLDGEVTLMTTPVGRTDLEACFWDEYWCIPVECHWMKLRVKSSFDLGRIVECRYELSGGSQDFWFEFNANGEWQEIIIDMSVQENFNWLGYRDEGTDDERPFPAIEGQALFRSFNVEFDFNGEDEMPLIFDYIGFFTTEEEARAYNGDFSENYSYTLGVVADTEAATEATTEAATEADTETTTEAATEADTEAASEAATEPETEAQEEPAAEINMIFIIVGAVAAVVVIAAVVVWIIKGKKGKKVNSLHKVQM